MAARRPRVAVSIGANKHVRDAGPGAIDEPAGLGSWVLDPASGTLTVSPGLRRLFGWPRHVVPRFGWFGEGVHPDDRVAAAAWLARVRVGKPAGEPCVFRVQAHDGDQRTIMVRATVVRANGRRQVLGAVQDLGDASAGPLAAIGAEQVFRGMFEHSVVGIFQSTPDGRYIMVNPALSRIYGYGSPAELRAALTDIGGQLYVDQARREEFVRQMRAHGAVSNFESQVYRGDGRIIWIAESCREVRTDAGVLLYYEGMVSDVTERRRIEDELREARDEAETANRVKNDFLATMSHELRTPLNAIIGFSESMQRELLGPIGTKVYKDYAGLILDSGRHLLAIITDILDIVRMDSGRLALQDDVVDIAALARDAARL
ncbi:MAG: PAS domain S-box protein, partial [Alphaproteobacteria bacterium]|nr:PAS domain S-box protein [Alphaproteobacteria bacterium]